VTTYHILKMSEDAELKYGWTEFATDIEASSAKRALTTFGVEEGTYVAVPARSWKPLTVTVEQTVKLTIT
jgi:putative aminopeptidase FrvX